MNQEMARLKLLTAPSMYDQDVVVLTSKSAERFLQIPKLLDGEDLVDLTPDRKSMYTYLME